MQRLTNTVTMRMKDMVRGGREISEEARVRYEYEVSGRPWFVDHKDNDLGVLCWDVRRRHMTRTVVDTGCK